MAYTLQSIIAKVGVFPWPPLAHLQTVNLRQGVEMVLLATPAQKHYGIPFCPLTDDGTGELPQALAELCGQLSQRGVIAYIEAEIFGGLGAQAHAIFSRGAALGPAVVSPHAINDALRALGISAFGAFDEFDAVGLGQHRHTDEWVK